MAINQTNPVSEIPARADNLPSYRYTVDQTDHIIYVSENWVTFAVENHAPPAVAEVVGDCIWRHIEDSDCQVIYQELFRKVRDKGLPIHFDFRCDSPVLKRYMRLEIAPGELKDHLQLESRLLREESRPYAAILDSEIPHTSELVKMCAWCKKIELDQTTWKEIDEAVQILSKPLNNYAPSLTHGICPDCEAELSE